MVTTIDQLKQAAEKAGMAKFMFLDKDRGPKTDVPYLVGHDFIDRLHKELAKQNGN